jgi:hypothetical protein
MRVAAAGVAIAALLLAPSAWALDTLGHATSGTFPEGGPASVQRAGGGMFGGFGGRPGVGRFAVPSSGTPSGAAGLQLFGSGGSSAGAGRAGGPPSGPGAGPGGPSAGGAGGVGSAGFGRGGGPGGAFGGNRSLTQVLSYVKQHGGGTIAVSSQSSAATSIISSNADVAGIGGFSGRESDVSVAWLAQKVSTGAIRWVVGEQSGAQSAGVRLPGDTRAGSKAAMKAVAKACRKVTVATSTSTGTGASATAGTGTTGGATSASATGTTGSSSTLYDCQGRAAALQSAGG